MGEGEKAGKMEKERGGLERLRSQEGEEEAEDGRQGAPGDPQLTQHLRPSISKSRWFSWS